MTLAASASVLGVLGGFLISHYVTDETGWYQKWFLALGSIGIAASLIALLITDLGSPLWTIHIVALGAALWALMTARCWVLFPVLALELAYAPTLLPAQLALVGLIPATGHLYGQGARKELLWSLAIPIVIIPASLL